MKKIQHMLRILSIAPRREVCEERTTTLHRLPIPPPPPPPPPPHKVCRKKVFEMVTKVLGHETTVLSKSLKIVAF